MTNQRVTLVRYTTKPDRTDENLALCRAVLAELSAAAPPHVTYSVFRDGADFVHLFVNTRDDSADPLTELAAFKAYAKDVADRCEAPPSVTRIDMPLLQTYGLP